MKWTFGVVSIITLISGIYNFEFWGGASVVTTVHVLLSVFSYLLWIVCSLVLVWRSRNPSAVSVRINTALLTCWIIGAIADHSPLTILVISPFMGIAKIFEQDIAPLIFIATLYFGIVVLIWLESLIITEKRKNLIFVRPFI